jgi:putative chitinase
MPGKAVLAVIFPAAFKRGQLDQWIEPLNDTMLAYQIDTKEQRAAWLANIGHETGEFQWTRELWGPTAQQRKYDTDPALMAALGNVRGGDGFKYRGRGLAHLTGRGNYTKYAAYKQIPCIEHPELLELPVYAADSAGWFFAIEKDMLPVAAAGKFKDTVKKWNGGFNGWAERKAYYDRALAVL